MKSEVERNPKFTGPWSFETKYQHSQAFEHKTPEDAEGIGLTQYIHISATKKNRKQLENRYHIDDPVSCAKPRMWMTEPVGQNAIFRDPIQDPIGSNHGRIHSTGQDQDSDEDNKEMKDYLQ